MTFQIKSYFYFILKVKDINFEILFKKSKRKSNDNLGQKNINYDEAARLYIQLKKVKKYSTYRLNPGYENLKQKIELIDKSYDNDYLFRKTVENQMKEYFDLGKDVISPQALKVWDDALGGYNYYHHVDELYEKDRSHTQFKRRFSCSC